jgi:ectoine hydroxylase-related dioxygenase (phytanoyl-CoA dioxygenase family)
LRIGSATVEVSAKPHTGCAKFVARFGKDAMRVLNSPTGRELRMRGVNCRVVEAGVVRLGDTITKEAAPNMTTAGDDELVLDSLLAGLAEDGYATVEGFLSADQVAEARSDLETILESTPYGRNDFEGHQTRRVYALFAKTRAFDGPATHPLVLGALDKVLGEYHLSAPVGICIGPGNPAQALHPDDGTYPIGRPHAELVVNVMLPLVDFTAENGATRIVPGSHRWVDRRPAPDEATVAPPMKAGTALFFLGSLWHGGGANDTNGDRLGVILHYSVAWLRPVENHVLAVPPEIVCRLEPRLQELLGYNIASPFTGYVDGRHPRRVLEALRSPA